jgi:hypothetical protein
VIRAGFRDFAAAGVLSHVRLLHRPMEGLMLKKAVLSISGTMALLATGPALAGSFERTTSCVGDYDAFSCSTIWRPAGDPYIRTVPRPATAQERAELVERNRKWIARCRPVIKQDRYSVARHHYAAPGCEFGVIESDMDFAGW